MKKASSRLTESERQVLNLLWDTKEPLTSSEIVASCKGKTWKDSYIHILINSLLKKNMIEIAGFKRTTKNYARSFKPSMTREEYNILELKQNTTGSSDALSRVFSALLEEETDSAVLDDLSQMLAEKKKKLAGRNY